MKQYDKCSDNSWSRSFNLHVPDPLNNGFLRDSDFCFLWYISVGLPFPFSTNLLHAAQRETHRFSATQEIPSILWNPTGHHIFYKSNHLSLSWARSIQSMPHPSHFLKIHLFIILPPTSGSFKWSLSLRFPHHNPVYTSPLLLTCYILRPSHSSRFDYTNNIR